MNSLDVVKEAAMTPQEKLGALVVATGQQTVIAALAWIQRQREAEEQKDPTVEEALKEIRKMFGI